MSWFFLSLAAGIGSILLALGLFGYIMKKDSGTEKMRKISFSIKEGALAYLRRQNRTLAVFVVIMAFIIGMVSGFLKNPIMGVSMAISYVLGSVCTTIAAYVGMRAAVETNVRVAAAAQRGLKAAFPIAFYGGAVMGLFVVGVSLLGIVVLFFIFKMGFGWSDSDAASVILGFSFGASALALFAKAGGGIYTKTADISADLVGKIELGIPEDDPRNPAVIADNVGDNVGDVAGMGADLTDSYIASIIATMIIGSELGGGILTTLPLLIASVGLFSSMIGLVFVTRSIKKSPGRALNMGTFSTCFIFVVLLFLITRFSGLEGSRWLGVFLPTVSGLAAGVIIGLTSDYFTSIEKKPTKQVAEASTTGAAINILTGFSYGLVSVAPPVLCISAATIVAWYIAKIFSVDPFYGVANAALGMLSIVGMIISADAYGPISDNAKGVAEQSGLGDDVVAITDMLDAAGNTSKAITKGFAIGSAALTVLALFAAYTHLVDIQSLDLISPKVIAGIFIGAVMPPLLSALLILSVGRNSERMIEEIRRQFREIPGLMEGKANPDYAKCVDIATAGALKELILPGVLSIIAPVLTLAVFGKEALAGFLAGSIVTGIIFALFMANSGGSWDNAKKYIEEGHHGGKGSDAHKAAVVGDTVGDPFKDTAGPSLNTMITVMSLVAEVFAPLILLIIA
ncbi:sodium-translocating pyrophosphatase [Pseudothermotoga lettingae]|uniref:K(+)-insensitive pyrophosphate-energized proton pump n=3 Tax=Pseudothermotoga TaxID=1643951 RepID=A8F8T7_PSELT|nr:sodium-translocating pyrophosphatase [Pseudothermotoga lettingae]ABV34571.1 V-type H(+)-translocating pyrophosphatase [Pseudothermotoga lettingae TMO]GLI48483.1 putative K(+)-stimulated pyrophosphate-energized sodium pump [Pseudothermotoga lettingae TMO]